MLSRIPVFVYDPSPALFATSALLYGAAALSVYHLHQKDKYQNIIVGAGIAVGCLLSVVMASVRDLGTYVPPLTTLGLAISMGAHYLRWLVLREEDQDAEGFVGDQGYATREKAAMLSSSV